MRIVAISDTHSYHRQVAIPGGDILIGCGDYCWRGELSIIEDFANWLKDLPHKNKVIIFGNHCLGFEHGPKRQPAIDMITNAGANYIEDSSIVIDGVKFHGSPITPFFCDWEWNRQRGPDIRRHWDKIPLDTNVLITHGPPYGILDKAPRDWDEYEHVGCEDLLNRIQELKQLKVSVFGHIHESYGVKNINGIWYANCAICTGNYKPINKPIVLDI